MSEVLTIQQLKSHLWESANILRGSIESFEYRNHILGLLFFKRLSDSFDEEYSKNVAKVDSDVQKSKKSSVQFNRPDGCAWADVLSSGTNIGTKINEIFLKITIANSPKLDGILDKIDFSDREKLSDASLFKLLHHFNKIKFDSKNVPADILGQAFDYLLERFSIATGRKGGEFYTPGMVAELMVRIIKPHENESIYDPCCGSGNIFIRAAEYLLSHDQAPTQLKLYGQEINQNTLIAARINMIIRGYDNVRIEHGDTFITPKFLDNGGLKRFDIVLANPPWNQSNWHHKEWKNGDPFNRFNFGLPPKNSADWAWIQLMYASLKSTGRMCVVMDNGALFRGGSESKIREAFLEKDLIEAVIGLPPNIFFSTSLPCCLLVFNNNKPIKHKSNVLFVDASKDYPKGVKLNRISLRDIERITNAYNSFVNKNQFSTVVDWEEIQGNDFNLNFDRYLSATKPEYIKIEKELKGKEVKLLSEIADVFIGYPPKPDERLDRGKHLIFGGRNIKENRFTTTTQDKYINSLDSLSFQRAILKPGDIIVSLLFKERKLYVYKDSDPKAVLSSSCALIRSQHGDYILDYLNSHEGKKLFLKQADRVTEGNIIPRLSIKDLKNIKIPIIPIDDLIRISNKQINQSSTDELELLRVEFESLKNQLEEQKKINKAQKKFFIDREAKIKNQISHNQFLERIKNGESTKLEFKSTLRWNIRANKIDSSMEYEVLKTIVAFCNSEGGELLIGVSDKGEYLGIDFDLHSFKKEDKFLLHIRNLITDKIQPSVLHFVEYEIVNLENKRVCSVKCKKSSKAIWLKFYKDKDSEFFVRSGPSSTRLPPPEAIDYINDHFKKKESKVF